MTDVEHLQAHIKRLENQIQALASVNRALIENLIQVGKTGSLTPRELEALRGQLLALRSIKPKN